MTPKVSVIIPNYNHALYLHQRIDSVLNQTLQPHEIIILDDCSTDNSVEIIESYLEKFPRIQFIKNDLNSGSTFVQWNKGVSIAKGDLIWIAESDDVADLNFLMKTISFFNKDDEIKLAYCQSNRMKSDGEITGTWKSFTDDIDMDFFNKDFIVEGEMYIESFLIHRNTIPNASAVLFSREAYIKCEGADEQLKNIGDWLVWLKILIAGKIAYTSECLNNFRYHSESVIAKAVKNTDKTSFNDWYGLAMRKELTQFLKKSKTKFSKQALKINACYMAIDKGNLGLFKLKKRKFLAGWKLIIQASFNPTLQSGFIKKAISLKKNK